MMFDWTHELFEQFDLEWNLAHGPSLDTLTDEEYLWEPVPGCWSIRPTGPGGRGEIEQVWPDPQPAPVTTIAWRLSHLAVNVFGLRVSHYFGDGSLTHKDAERPLTAKEGVAYFRELVTDSSPVPAATARKAAPTHIPLQAMTSGGRSCSELAAEIRK